MTTSTVAPATATVSATSVPMSAVSAVADGPIDGRSIGTVAPKRPELSPSV